MTTDKIAEIKRRHIEVGSAAPRAAHADRGYLLAEVEKLRAEVERLTRERDEAHDFGLRLNRERDAARAEVERLRENVDRLGKEVERADRLREEIARVKADNRYLVNRALKVKP